MATSRNNVRKRGTTWTYYAYVTDGTGNRRQVSKGGFATRREAEAARVEALSTMANGTWVRPERLTVRDFLVDEWLPTQRPPTLEESTYTSYIRLHVLPHIGGLALQQLTQMDLNALYRTLLESGRQPPGVPPRQHAPATLALSRSSEPTGSPGSRWPTRSATRCPTSPASPATPWRRCTVERTKRSRRRSPNLG